MRVSFGRTGGFAGMRMTVTIDSDSLSPQEEHNLRDMISTPRDHQDAKTRC